MYQSITGVRQECLNEEIKNIVWSYDRTKRERNCRAKTASNMHTKALILPYADLKRQLHITGNTTEINSDITSHET